ncbi:MAG TPA: rhamnan synthesis F family protein [Puia sp.]|nr:rhamnan synthesis F family protein [Puia sp.]
MKVAVHAHLHYADLTEKVAGYLRNIPCPYDLIVSVTDPAAVPAVRGVIGQRVPHARLTVLPVVNKGRDVKPFYTDAAHLLSGYDIIGHIHGKKSVFNNGATAGWLEYLLDCLMGSEMTVRSIFDRFQTEPSTGLIYPASFDRMPYWANTWLSNRGWAACLRDRLQLPALPDSYFSYPVGNMFWARGSAIRPLLQLGLCDSDYPPEAGQNDGEIMHALERMTTVVARAQGFTNYVIQPKPVGIAFTDDRQGIDFSAYRGNSLASLRRVIEDPGIKVVSFDIFDTLVVRALSDPADIFDLMQPEVAKITRQPVAFRRLRIEADGWQRQRLSQGEDVTLAAIYERIGEVLNLSPAVRHWLMALELRLETKFVRARKSVVAIMDYAWRIGKRIVLVSDMYLDKSFVAGMLERLGITQYHELYISSDTGRRKDNRTFFPYLLASLELRPQEVVHIGDNEHSDLQIPGDLGIATFHVMRQMELFRRTALGKTGFPPLERSSLFFRLSFGLMLVNVFDDPFPTTDSPVDGSLRNFGYWYFGPTLLAYIKWVMDRAKADGVDTLYFLARDGEIMIRIYRLLQERVGQAELEQERLGQERLDQAGLLQERLGQVAPAAKYLEVSRRSLGLPFVRQYAQLDKLLQPEYAGGSLAALIRIRLGIELEDHPEIDIRDFKFSSPDDHVSIPADLARIRPLCHRLWQYSGPQLERDKIAATGYLQEMGVFDEKEKAVVDIGYSGTLQRILNDIVDPDPTAAPIHGYYMVLYRTFDALLRNPAVRATGLFGDRIDPYLKALSVDRYSLFYEMVLSSVRGQVTGYTREADGTTSPVYAKVDPEEQDKLDKLPVIHEGIMDYCRDVLDLLEDPELVRWDEMDLLLTPFQNFLEQPTRADMEMLAGYSLDDHYCGQGILYWAPPDGADGGSGAYAGTGSGAADCLWKKYVPQAPLWGNGVAPVAAAASYGASFGRQEQEIFSWYQEQYEVMPGWYKKIGQCFKVLFGTKRIRIVLEDVNYVPNRPTKAEEIQAWYDKEYEVLPGWYKRFGQFIRLLMGRRSWKSQTHL